MDEAEHGVMIEVKVDSRSLASARKDFREYPKGAVNAIRKTLAEAGIAIQNRARLGSPVDTGRLMQSIHFETQTTTKHNYKDRKGDSFNGSLGLPLKDLEVVVGSNVQYAAKMEKRDGFLMKAFDAISQKVLKNIQFDLNPKNAKKWLHKNRTR